MREVFEQLFENLNGGRRVAVVSEYHDSGIKRSLVYEDDHEAWNGLVQGNDAIYLTHKDGRPVLIEHYSTKPRLIILGGGHIALPLSHIGASLGFRVVVFDDRPAFANETRFPDAETVICDSFDNVKERIKVNENDYVIIVTRGHRHDSLCLHGILKGEFPRYVGMIGSRRRVDIVKKQLAEETSEIEKLSRLHAPIGLAIGAVTPVEIAISILAEVIKNLRLGPSNMDSTVPLKPWKFINPDMELLEWLAKERTEMAAIATVVATQGSTPRETGAKMIILPHGRIFGSIGGGCAEADVMQKAIDIIRDGGHYMIDIDLTDTAEEDGMVCGGSMKVLIEAV
ncbi:MAG: XdhC family protein [Leptospirales bacterium]|nr:XdhC family protein [Leptospirales bacterium]